MKPWTEADKQELRTRWTAGERMAAIASAMGRTRNSIIGQSNRMHLQFHPGTRQPIAADSDAAIFGATLYPSRVKEPPLYGILKPGSYQRKLGGTITKGKWKGFPLYSLSLEERATCPRTCRQWLSCYGNASGQSLRYSHGIRLVEAIHRDLSRLQYDNPRGFVVRLHQLGDFWSVEYLTFWRFMLDEFPALRLFGYTARLEGPIAVAIEALRDERWDRFAIRSSGAQSGPRTTVVLRERDAGKAIICPAQTGKTDCCATCGLCWSPAARRKSIAFLAH